MKTEPLEPNPVIEAYKAHVDRTLLRENLRRTVAERMANLVALQRLAEEARKAGVAATAHGTARLGRCGPSTRASAELDAVREDSEEG
jgi:cytosine/adenosine deaminase-related metal-dependent hydrolase